MSSRVRGDWHLCFNFNNHFPLCNSLPDDKNAKSLLKGDVEETIEFKGHAVVNRLAHFS